MKQHISIGNQGFDSIREENSFYIDKTYFIKEWWESRSCVTLVTRPRRFGKTLNMSMLNCFFSMKYAGRSDLFDGLSVWQDEKYRRLQGTYPTIFVSFAEVKQSNCADAIRQIKKVIAEAYQPYEFLAKSDKLSELHRAQFRKVSPEMDDVTAQNALKDLSNYLSIYYGCKTVILLDEYDTPMQEAYINGYWDELVAFLRSFYNLTFKTNPYMERSLMTGITRVSKESIFSDLNNLDVVTATSKEYAACFGFTEDEVFGALDAFCMSDKKQLVKQWYDGFSFGSQKDIYNPWSITNFLMQGELRPYWTATSSNALINKLIQQASGDLKAKMELLMQGQSIVVNFDEQVVFSQLDYDENAVWSLLVASGYLKVNEVEYRGITRDPWYHLSITNLETIGMFSNMFRGWFQNSSVYYNEFVRALLQNNLNGMNEYMNEVALHTFSNFDVGKHPSGRTEPERFYHGFVLGLLVELRDSYIIRSNRESGYGRYDVILIPNDKKSGAYVLEFKVQDLGCEKTLEDTAQSALNQIEQKCYDAELQDMGIPKEHITHYGFAFAGKSVLIAGQRG